MSTTLNDIPTDYLEADEFLGSKSDRPAGNNTRVQRVAFDDSADAFGIVLHHTVVVWLFDDGMATLNSEGWQTVTTKERINRVIRDHGWNLYQEDYVWYLWDRDNDETYRFSDGMMINLKRSRPNRANSIHRVEK